MDFAIGDFGFTRLLQKQRVDKALPVLKVLLIIVAVVPLLLLIYALITGTIEVTTALTRLENSINEESSHYLTKKRPKLNYNPSLIAEKNLFGTIGGGATTTAQVRPVSKIPLTLVGTFVAPGETASAIIEDKRKATQELFDVNDMIFGEAKLVAVFPNKVEISRNGEIEVLELEAGLVGSDSGSNISVAGSSNDIIVSEAEVDDALSNLPLLLTQVRAVPFFKDGVAVGLRLFAIKQGSLFEKVGLKNGDILKTINGNSMGDFTQAMKLFEQLKSERSLSLSLERNREEMQYNYKIR